MSDLIERQAAIDALKKTRAEIDVFDIDRGIKSASIGKAIYELERLPSVRPSQPKDRDEVYLSGWEAGRAELLKQMADKYDDAYAHGYTAAESKYRKMMGERKTGKWIKRSKPTEFCTEWWYVCSECGNRPLRGSFVNSEVLSEFCPHCGCRMTEGEEQ